MSKKWTLAAVAAVVAGLACGSAMAEFKDFKVNGEVVTKAMQESVAAQTIATNPNPHSVIAVADIENQVRDMITDMVVMAQYAKKEGLDKDPAVQDQMRTAAMSVLWQAAVEKYFKEHPVTEKEIKAAYDAEAQRYGKNEYQVRHIMVKTEKEARDILAQLQKGASFEKLAKEKSVDDASASDGGLLDWQSASVFTGEMGSLVASLKKGELGSRPVQSTAGWHIVKINDVRPAQDFPKYEERKPEIKHTLEQRSLQNFVHLQRTQAEIK